MKRPVLEGTECEDGRVIVATGDITTLPVDAVVNAANSSLMGGGGVDGAIHRAGGGEILAECREVREKRYPDGLPTGEAVITTAGRMPARFVIHTVGPVWRGGSSGEDDLLAAAYRSSLRIAADEGFEEIAFPAISTGVYGFPKQRAAGIVARTLADHFAASALPLRVYLVFFAPGDTETYLRGSGCH